MARMLPRRVADTIQSSAERRIFHLIREELSDEWTALHSLGLSIHARKPWAEIDFVLVGPPGVFCLEVKGGRIERIEGVWKFKDRHGNVTSKTEGPFEQVGGASSALTKFLFKHQPALRTSVVGYGVVTPDIDFSKASPEVQQATVFDATDRDKPFSLYIRRLAEFWQERLGRNRELDPILRGQIVELLRGDFDLRLSLRAQIRQVERDLIRLTDEQREILSGLDDNPQAIVRGRAGTGKTQLAVDHAVAKAKQGARVFLTCYSRRLGDHFEAITADVENLTAGGFHKYVRKVVHDSGLHARIPDAQEEDLFQVFYPEAALEGLLELDLTGSYDVLVVDEAQDLLLQNYLDVFDGLLDGGLTQGHWRFFLDPLQDLFGEHQPQPMHRLRQSKPAEFRLTRNCRNTQQIAVTSAILSGTQPDPTLGSEGPDVEHIWWSDGSQQRRRVSRFISRLLSRSIQPEDIVVVGPRKLSNSVFADGLLDVPFELVEDGGPRTITYSTVAGYKGLEADVIVVVDVLEISEATRADLYVATSRARALLAIAIKESARPEYDEAAREFGRLLSQADDP